MKIAVINFSGNVGKSTVARHLLAPRMNNAQVIAVESLNSDGTEGEAIKGKQFGQLSEALALLDDPTPEETRMLGCFRYSRNLVALHTDTVLMPKRRRAWTSWNHIGMRAQPGEGAVTYWMNRLQSLKDAPDLFVTLNPNKEIAPDKLIRTEVYDHPLFDASAIAAQREFWDIQGARRTWFCGSYLGHGFHEDALQSGLAVAEQLGGVRRPWTVDDESGRIHLRPAAEPLSEVAA